MRSLHQTLSPTRARSAVCVRVAGVLLEKEGVALRGLFLIDPEGVLRQSTINDLPVGRSVDETLRSVETTSSPL